MSKRAVKYVYSDDLMTKADENPAVQGRASLAHQLIACYGLLENMQLLQPKVCNSADLRGFHSRDYVQQLEQYPDSDSSADEETDLKINVYEEYGLGFDCPIWPGIKNYACSIAGATISACEDLCKSQSGEDTAPVVIINWTGGWHHAQRDKAAGFCYVSDIVLGILELRKRFQRVLYVDLDVHHGDGVQYAFETTKRVLTLSFHKFECGFYPGTGAATDCGFAGGKGYAVNFPYLSGIGGSTFRKYFKRITSQVLKRYQPDACVIQCGADAIVGDPLGDTNLTPNDLIDCVYFVLKNELPTVLLGGGGYNLCNTSRYWTLLTAAVCGRQLSEDIPDDNAHFLKYGPDYCLNIEAKKFIKDLNTEAYLENCAKVVEENLNKYEVDSI